MPKITGNLTNQSVKRDHRHLQYRCHNRRVPLFEGIAVVICLCVGIAGTIVFIINRTTPYTEHPWLQEHDAAAFVLGFVGFIMAGSFLYKLLLPTIQVLSTKFHFQLDQDRLERDFEFEYRPGVLGQKSLKDRVTIPEYIRIGEKYIFIEGPAPALIPTEDIIWLYSCQTKKKQQPFAKKDNQKLVYQIHFMTNRGSNYYLEYEKWEDMRECMLPLELTFPDLIHEYDSDRYLRWWFSFSDFQGEMDRLKQISIKARTEMYPTLRKVIRKIMEEFPERKMTAGPFSIVVTQFEQSRGSEISSPNDPCYLVTGYAFGTIKEGDLLVIYDNVREAGTCVVDEILYAPNEPAGRDGKYTIGECAFYVKQVDAVIQTPDLMVMSSVSKQDSALPTNPVLLALVSTAGLWGGDHNRTAYLSYTIQSERLLVPIFRRKNEGEDKRFTLISVARGTKPGIPEEEQLMLAVLTDLEIAIPPNHSTPEDGELELRFINMRFEEAIEYVRAHFYGISINPFGPLTANLPNDFLHTIAGASISESFAKREIKEEQLLTAHGTEWRIVGNNLEKIQRGEDQNLSTASDTDITQPLTPNDAPDLEENYEHGVPSGTGNEFDAREGSGTKEDSDTEDDSDDNDSPFDEDDIPTYSEG